MSSDEWVKKLRDWLAVRDHREKAERAETLMFVALKKELECNDLFQNRSALTEMLKTKLAEAILEERP